MKFFRRMYLRLYRIAVGTYPPSTLVRFIGRRGKSTAATRSSDPSIGSYGITCSHHTDQSTGVTYDTASFDGRDPQPFATHEIEPVE